MYPRIMVVLTAFVLSTAALPEDATAQDRQGVWGGFGFGVGSARLGCDDCDADAETGGLGNLRFGGTINPHLLVSGELNVWAKTFAFEEDVEATARLYNFSGVLTYYPGAAKGFFLKAGAGSALADMQLTIPGLSTNLTVDIGNGWGLIGGVGYDVRLGRRVSITPAVTIWSGRLGNLTMDGETLLSNLHHNVVDFSIGITFH